MVMRKMIVAGPGGATATLRVSSDWTVDARLDWIDGEGKGDSCAVPAWVLRGLAPKIVTEVFEQTGHEAEPPSQGPLTASQAMQIVVDHLDSEMRGCAAQDFARACIEAGATTPLTVEAVAQIAEANEEPDALPVDMWERLRPGLGLQKAIESKVRVALEKNGCDPTAVSIDFNGGRVVDAWYGGHPVGETDWSYITDAGVLALDWRSVHDRRTRIAGARR